MAIPAATDIAFALGVISLLQRRLPSSLAIFLLSLAIFDDVGAILIIAAFYGSELQAMPIVFAGVVFVVLMILNLSGVRSLAPYMLLGIVLWVAFLKSGVHATVAGVLCALTVPVLPDKDASPLASAEAGLHPWVAFGVLPIFAFANAGIALDEFSLQTLGSPLTLGIIAGLLLGKQLGVFGVGYLIVRLGWAKLPENTTWLMFYGVCTLAGIGFTMSLFIGSLAFTDPEKLVAVRVGVFAASLLSAALGFFVLFLAARAGKATEQYSGSAKSP